MKPTAASQAPPEHRVQVVLSACSADDAESVLGVLRRYFSADEGADDAGHGPTSRGPARPTVWTAAFDTSRVPQEVSRAALGDAVTVDVQGGPVAVARLRDVLHRTFEVEDAGAASGDQEVDLQLRLRGR
ncbi:hypothetical protein [Streptomyces sp. TLI_146]|uniref:hypothetical protein n=1 Tax=Streptomyces sp. TLI_146 TaxID=1938858 RepID=UPI000C7147FC|nr:hypothetical protein [Streptomyces sp. TLI_146]PKV83706.1 hypothetical protein BX283_1213 [Streptomyces sp. TLI_146]